MPVVLGPASARACSATSPTSLSLGSPASIVAAQRSRSAGGIGGEQLHAGATAGEQRRVDHQAVGQGEQLLPLLAHDQVAAREVEPVAAHLQRLLPLLMRESATTMLVPLASTPRLGAGVNTRTRSSTVLVCSRADAERRAGGLAQLDGHVLGAAAIALQVEPGTRERAARPPPRTVTSFWLVRS